ncbi:hypothetical protein [Planotetraspora kaengkrachanensis]|uniref:Uncharacterized protein n=1 Tax=Planotetraspora kaengkrachanensis TaxID=575193 RepID=A0A8J3PQ54_9ACTN|nr:hypothetical protein [Planotetraspora kaengkrachanensis]GIG78361.1 hypothetical protein Pka01_14880 [Planotetraspora kaengkrachanensis]
MMAKKKGLNSNRRLNDRLWDDTGQEWARVPGDTYRVDPARAADLFADREVRIGYWRFGGPVNWADSPTDRGRQHQRWLESLKDANSLISVTEWSKQGGGCLLVIEESC